MPYNSKDYELSCCDEIERHYPDEDIADEDLPLIIFSDEFQKKVKQSKFKEYHVSSVHLDYDCEKNTYVFHNAKDAVDKFYELVGEFEDDHYPIEAIRLAIDRGKMVLGKTVLYLTTPPVEGMNEVQCA